MNMNVFDNSGMYMRERENNLRNVQRPNSRNMPNRGRMNYGRNENHNHNQNQVQNQNQSQSQSRNYNHTSADNGRVPEFPAYTPLAMAYVPYQNWGNTFSVEDAFNNGTLFCDLVFPLEVC